MPTAVHRHEMTFTYKPAVRELSTGLLFFIFASFICFAFPLPPLRESTSHAAFTEKASDMAFPHVQEEPHHYVTVSDTEQHKRRNQTQLPYSIQRRYLPPRPRLHCHEAIRQTSDGFGATKVTSRARENLPKTRETSPLSMGSSDARRRQHGIRDGISTLPSWPFPSHRVRAKEQT